MDRPKRQCKKPIRFKTTSSSSSNEASQQQVKKKMKKASSTNVEDDIQAIRAACSQLNSITDTSDQLASNATHLVHDTNIIPSTSETDNNDPVSHILNSEQTTSYNTTYGSSIPFLPAVPSTYTPIPLWNPSFPPSSSNAESRSYNAVMTCHPTLTSTITQSLYSPSSLPATHTKSSSYNDIYHGGPLPGLITPGTPASFVSVSLPSTITSQDAVYTELQPWTPISKPTIVEDISFHNRPSSSYTKPPIPTGTSSYSAASALVPSVTHTSRSTAINNCVTYALSSNSGLPSQTNNIPRTTPAAPKLTSLTIPPVSFVPPRTPNISHLTVATPIPESVNRNTHSRSGSLPRTHPNRDSGSVAPTPAPSTGNDIPTAVPGNNIPAALPGNHIPAAMPGHEAAIEAPRIENAGGVPGTLVRINERLGAIERTLRSQRRRGTLVKPAYLPFGRVADILNLDRTDHATYDELVQYLEHVGGFTLKEVCNLCLKEVIKDETVGSFTWWGRDDGRRDRPVPFYNTVLAVAINDAASNNTYFRPPTQRDFGKCMREAIRIAKQRVRNKNRRNQGPPRQPGIRRRQEAEAERLFAQHRDEEEVTGDESSED